MCSNKEASFDAVIDIIIEKLNAGGTVTFTPSGTSMMPMLRDGEDAVTLTKPKGRLRLYDVPLYRRDNGKYVLHRVVDFGNNGTYVLCGDNQFHKEKNIRDDQIIAVVTGFVRKGTAYTMDSIFYRGYVYLWTHTRMTRRAVRSVKRRLGVGERKKNGEQEQDQA